MDRKQVYEAQTPMERKVSPLRRGVESLERGDEVTAQAALEAAVETATSSREAAVAHYYLGVLAARRGAWDEARQRWRVALSLGFAAPHLRANLGELEHRLAERRAAAGDVEGALVAADEAARLKGDDRSLDALRAHLWQQRGYRAAQAGRWEEAVAAWHEAWAIEGPTFRVACNLALAHEHLGRWEEAAAMWQEALHRRPRRADHPDAPTEAQIARLWRRLAEAHCRAGQPGEAIAAYRRAVRWEPDDLALRMTLVEQLLAQGRIRAAYNEVRRVLERNPDYVPALVRMGELLARSEWWQAGQAEQFWKRALEIEPTNREAVQGLVSFYLKQGEQAAQWGDFGRAIAAYQQALALRPDDGHILAVLGSFHIYTGDWEKGERFFAQALEHAGDDLNVYHEIIAAWLEHGEAQKAWAVARQAEATIPDIPFQFYLSHALWSLHIGDEAAARPWAERALQRIPADMHPWTVMGEAVLLVGALEMAEEYLRQASSHGEPGDRIAMLRGILMHRRGDDEAARRYLDRAEALALQGGNDALAQHVRALRDLLDIPRALWSMILERYDADAIFTPL